MVKVRKKTDWRDGKTVRFSFCSAYIDAIGYDAQCELLEVRLIGSGKIRRYVNVPEEVWYQFRESASPDIYYRSCICGHFPEADTREVGGRGGRSSRKCRS